MSSQRSGRHAAKRGLWPRRTRRASEAGLAALGTGDAEAADDDESRAEDVAEDDGRPVANKAGLLALGAQIDKARPKRSRRRRRIYWAVGVVGLVIVLAAGALAGYAWWLNRRIHHVKVGGLRAGATTGVDQGTENILLVGSTSRCALATQNPAYGLCSQGITGVNSDVVMILHLNAANKMVSILSVPRDLFIPNARSTGANKIDAALAEGPTQLVNAVEQDFAIPIQHFVELNFDTFANVVDALGGIKMYFPMPVFDAYSGLNVPNPGCQQLNGVQALQVVRARHLQYKTPTTVSSNPAYWPQENESDLARIRRDHEFLRVLAAQVSKQGLGNPLTDSSILEAVTANNNLTVDTTFSLSHMVNLLLTFHGVNTQTAPQWTLPVSVSTSLNYYYQGSNYGNIEFPTQSSDQQIIDQFLGISNNIDSMTGLALPAPGAVTVSVHNGSGTPNQAQDTASALQALGFQIAGTGDVTPPAQESETVVYYGSTSPNVVAAAQLVARSMSGSVILGFDPSMVTNGAMVTVVTGSNFAVNAPAPPTPSTSSTSTTAPAKGHPTTTTTAPTTTTTAPSTSSGFTPPTPSVEALQAWDPRSCTPSGGQGP